MRQPRVGVNNGMILKVLWNGHQAWNGHLGRTGILPVSCLFSSGQDAHSTLIHSLIEQRPLPTLPILIDPSADFYGIPPSAFA